MAVGPRDPNVVWLLHRWATLAAQGELDVTLPYIEVDPLGEDDADLDLLDTRVTPKRPIGRTGEFNVLEQFSAGERRWVDEALATSARALKRFGDTLTWQAAFLDDVPDDELLAALEPVSDEIEALVARDEGWTADALEATLRAIEGPIRRAAAKTLKETDQDAYQRGWLETSISGFASLRPQLTVRVFDEPDAHLHPSAQRAVAQALNRLRLRGENVLLTSHSPHFLDLPEWTLMHVQRTPEGPTLSTLAPGDLDARHALAGQMGMTRGELLTRVGYLLIVEGEHDRLMLETFYATELDEAGVAVVRMHGTSNLLATAELDFVDRHLDVPIGVLLDYVRLDRVASNTPNDRLTAEEKALRRLRKACHRRNRPIGHYGLRRPDVVAYIDESVIRGDVADFPGWTVVLQRFEERTPRPSFKGWLLERYGVDFTRTDLVRRAVQGMHEAGLKPSAELTAMIVAVTRQAGAGRWPDKPG